MEYGQGDETYCGSWTIRWNFHLEPFVRDGESTGFGRFVGLVDGEAVIQLWIIQGGLKIEHAPGYSVQLNTDDKVITVLHKKTPAV